MSAPTYVSAGVGATDAAGAWSFSQLGPTVGNVIVIQILQDGNTNGAITGVTFDELADLAGTASAATLITGPNADGSWPVGSPAAGRQFLWIGRATSVAGVTVSGANSTSEDLYARMYEFTSVSVGTTLATVIENGSAGIGVNGTGTSVTIADTAVTTLGPDRLALQLVAANDDIAIDAFAGETGGDWVELVAEYAEASGTDGALQIQGAPPLTTVEDFLAAGAGSQSFRGVGGTDEMAAQSITWTGGPISRIIVRLGSTGVPTDSVVLAIQADSAGAPSGVDIATATFPAVSVVGAGGDVTFAYTTTGSLAAGTYWIVARRNGARDTSNYCSWFDSSAAYSGGAGAVSNSSVWSGSSDKSFRTGSNIAGTINGGTDTVVSAGWGVVGFALIGTTVAATYQPRYGFVNHANPGLLMQGIRRAWHRRRSGIFVPDLWTPGGVTV